jgi:trehalose 6-phosphate synthase/phosphatase
LVFSFGVLYFKLIACSAGGLVTAVAPVVIQAKGIWVGWPGLLDDINEPIPESDPNDKTPTAGLLSEKVRNSSLPSDCSQTLYILQFFLSISCS